MITYASERIVDAWDEIMPLARRHMEEIGQTDLVFDPDFDRFVALDKAGVLALFTVRFNGVLVGYSAFFVQPHLHYKGSVVGINDAIYLIPEKRLGKTGVKLVRYAEIGLKARGVEKIYYHAKLANQFGDLLAALQYHSYELSYFKRVN